MKKFKVVVTDWEFEDLRYEEAILDHNDIELVRANCQTEEDVIDVCKDADGIINQYAPIGRKVIEKLDKCKVITRYGVGINTIDSEEATKKGICVANVPDYCMDEVSDHALALLLNWSRQITCAHQNVKNKKWDFKLTKPIYRLKGKILGLVGFGKIPRALAEKVKPLGLRVIAYDPYYPENKAAEDGVSLVSLDQLCKESDFISIHAPLTEQTQGLMSKNEFGTMKNTAVIINTARGPVIDEEALIDALSSGEIAGAALDVIENEPINHDHRLLLLENVILTPHMAWYSEESEMEMRSKAALGVKEVLLHNQYPRYLVNMEVKNKLGLNESENEDSYALLSK